VLGDAVSTGISGVRDRSVLPNVTETKADSSRQSKDGSVSSERQMPFSPGIIKIETP